MYRLATLPRVKFRFEGKGGKSLIAELLKSLVEEGKKKQQQAAERTNSIKEERFVSTDTNREQPKHDTINEIAEV